MKTPMFQYYTGDNDPSIGKSWREPDGATAARLVKHFRSIRESSILHVADMELATVDPVVEFFSLAFMDPKEPLPYEPMRSPWHIGPRDPDPRLWYATWHRETMMFEPVLYRVRGHLFEFVELPEDLR